MGPLGAAWGIGGIVLLLGGAVVRLTPPALRAVTGPLEGHHWAALVGWVAWMAWAEGYRGFQREFAPRVAVRARHLAAHPTLLRVLLAPAFCIGYFGAPRRRQMTSFAVTAGVLCLVVIVRQVPHPWRGIVDAGVVAGLLWGLVALAFACARAFGARGLDHPAEVVP